MFLVSQLKTVAVTLFNVLLGTLDSDEREAVSGDLLETNESLGASLLQVWGLVIRRQLRQWSSLQSWLTFCAVTVPIAILLAQAVREFAGWSAIYSWMLINNTDATLLRSSGFWQTAMESVWAIGKFGVMLFCCSWVCGRFLAKVASKMPYSMALLFTFASLWVMMAGFPSHVQRFRSHANDLYFPNGPVFASVFYRDWFPLIMYVFSVLFPLVLGLLQQRGSNSSKTANSLWLITIVLVLASLVERPWLLLEMWSWQIVPKQILHLPSLLPVALLASSCFFFYEFVEHRRRRSPIS